MLAWPVLCALVLETFSEGLHCQPLRLILFGDVLLQVVTVKYLGLYKQTLQVLFTRLESSKSVSTNSGDFGAFLGYFAARSCSSSEFLSFLSFFDPLQSSHQAAPSKKVISTLRSFFC